MTNYSDKKILVIGSYNHSLANRCEGWYFIDSIYLGDYHLIIMNLQSLYEGDLTEEMKEKLKKVRMQINEIIRANTQIICITAPTISKGGFIVSQDGKNIPSISNYHWCPVYLNFVYVKEPGTSFEEKEKASWKYFSFVKKWSHYLEGYSLLSYRPRVEGGNFSIKINSLLRNLAKRPLAFELRFVESYPANFFSGIREPVTLESPNSILFLPPPTEITVEEAINFLLKEERGIVEIEETKLPEWTEKIVIFGEEKIKSETKELEELKSKYEEKLNERFLKLKKLIKFKKLLTASGEELENIVEEAFKLLGIDIKMGPKGKEDRIIIDPITHSELPIEITGVKYSIPESKLNQLIGRLSDEERIKKIKCKCKGILIGNHYKEEPLNSNLQGRKNPFEPDVIKKAEVSKISLLSTLELFKAINAKLQNKNLEPFITELFNKPGEIKFKENYEA